MVNHPRLRCLAMQVDPIRAGIWWHFPRMPLFGDNALREQGNADVFAPLFWEEGGWGKPLWCRAGTGGGCREEGKGRD